MGGSTVLNGLGKDIEQTTHGHRTDCTRFILF